MRLVVDLLALCFCTFFICLCVKAGQCYLDLEGKGTKLGRHAVLLANNKYPALFTANLMQDSLA